MPVSYFTQIIHGADACPPKRFNQSSTSREVSQTINLFVHMLA